ADVDALAGARLARDEEVRHRAKVEHDGRPRDITPERDGQLGRRATEDRRLDDVTQRYESDGDVRDLYPHDALAGDRGLDAERARGEREREVVVERLDAREEDARRDLQLVPRDDRSGRDLDDLGGDVEVRQRLFDDLGALADLAAGPGVTRVAEAKNVERRQRPRPVCFGVEHAFDGDVLVWQPGDRGSERALWSRGRLVRLRRRKEPQGWFGRLSGRLGALDGHIDPERRGGGLRLLVFALLHVDAPSEAACRAARQADTRPQG